MRSIDNLRKYVLTAPSICSTTRAILVGYIDNIEREVGDNERFRAEAEPFADRLREAVGERADVTLFGVDYTPYPLDADGVPVHVGDVMEWCDSGDTLEVIGIGDDTIFYIDRESDRTYAEWTAARNKRHHHAPTVEDVLREFASNIADVLGGDDFKLDDNDELYAEYAARLRLAGDE